MRRLIAVWSLAALVFVLPARGHRRYAVRPTTRPDGALDTPTMPLPRISEPVGEYPFAPLADEDSSTLARWYVVLYQSARWLEGVLAEQQRCPCRGQPPAFTGSGRTQKEPGPRFPYGS